MKYARSKSTKILTSRNRVCTLLKINGHVIDHIIWRVAGLFLTHGGYQARKAISVLHP
jgi:hypothetical protein